MDMSSGSSATDQTLTAVSLLWFFADKLGGSFKRVPNSISEAWKAGFAMTISKEALYSGRIRPVGALLGLQLAR